jgi:tRNA U54 and U55 pseudouridine synthase Pus10
LQELYDKAKREVNIASNILKVIDLEELREIIESEIYVEIFNITFSDEHIKPYLNAIKKLENRLYSNYNMIVMLYADSLESK